MLGWRPFLSLNFLCLLLPFSFFCAGVWRVSLRRATFWIRRRPSNPRPIWSRADPFSFYGLTFALTWQTVSVRDGFRLDLEEGAWIQSILGLFKLFPFSRIGFEPISSFGNPMESESAARANLIVFAWTYWLDLSAFLVRESGLELTFHLAYHMLGQSLPLSTKLIPSNGCFNLFWMSREIAYGENAGSTRSEVGLAIDWSTVLLPPIGSSSEWRSLNPPGSAKRFLSEWSIGIFLLAPLG